MPREASPPRCSFLLKPADQETVAAFVIVAVAMLSFYLWRNRSNLIEIDAATHHPPALLVDVNSATWPELTLLPGISETHARRIVASRQSEGPFDNHDDLLRVSGIGPKSLAKMRPFLLPMTSPPLAEPRR